MNNVSFEMFWLYLVTQMYDSNENKDLDSYSFITFFSS